MEEYERVTSGVRDFLTRNQYCDPIMRSTENCFVRMKAYLAGKGWDYTPYRADEWFQSHEDEFSATEQSRHRMTLLRLKDIYECGEIRTENDLKLCKRLNDLAEPLKNSLDLFLEEQKQLLSPKTVARYKRSCALFLFFMQKAGCSNINEITFDLMITFYQSDNYYGKSGKGDVNSYISVMMRFFFDRGDVPYGFSVIFHYLSSGKGTFWNQISAEAHEKISVAMVSSDTMDLRELVSQKEKLIWLHKDSGYAKTTIDRNNRIIDLLILFLEMNGYRYSPEISMIWFHEIRPMIKTEEHEAHRALCMLSSLCSTSEIRLEKIYRTKPSAFELLPEWCAGPAADYVVMKENEGWAKSTMDMIRSSICRFCSYLDKIGVRSFRELDFTHIKQFNADDKHETPSGKNAYNTRIRKFLFYLGEHNLLKNPMLFAALTCTSAPREAIVVVLTEEEMAELNECLNDGENGISLRKKAMLLLGLKMGMRSSDIVNLKFENINWETQSICFIQKKTLVEVNLPMPDEVGNALFHYITEERKQKADPDIFLSENGPFKAVARSACSRALQTALPNRDVKGSGFHVTRRTYATNLLRQGVGVDMVSEALGQKSTDSVSRYLSLDSERMRMCPLSLSDFAIEGWKDDK